MIKRVLVIGGYGNFGQFICKSLAAETAIKLIIAGRSLLKANKFAKSLESINKPETVQLDIGKNLDDVLAKVEPDIIIHTSGPFQFQDHYVAEAAIKFGAHYLDLADGRKFVSNITNLHKKAKEKDVLVISGASSVPCLTSAIIDHYRSEFNKINSINYGISTAQKTNPGLATTSAILSYTGKPFQTLVDGNMKDVFGWQDIRSYSFAGLGSRLFANCDVPDLDIFPKRYPELKTLRFYAGIEIRFIHITLWAMSWLVRAGVLKNLKRLSPQLIKISRLFNWFGSANSALFMTLEGYDHKSEKKQVSFELVAKKGDGPFIPCMPVILLTKKLVNNTIAKRGAFPCVGFIDLDEYLNALSPLAITWQEND